MKQFIYDRNREFLSRGAIRDEQAQLLAEHIEYCRARSPYYAKVCRDIPAVTAADSFDILASLPFTSKDDLAGNINQFVAAPECDIRDIAFSSGTTGAPLPIVYTENDLRRLAYNEQKAFIACGMTPLDKILLTCTMDRCFIAGLAYREGVRAVGAAVIRNGLNSLESHAGIIASMKPSIIIGVPSFLKKLGKFLDAEKIDHGFVKKLICIGEPVRGSDCQLSLPGSLLESLWGAGVYSTYASSETITSFCDCEAACGGHLHHDLAILEIIDDNGNPCGPGVQGEVVITPLQMEGMPLLRFKTGDISQYFDEQCACGRSTPRLGPIAGRKQQMMKINGTTVYPETVFSCLEALPGIIDYYITARSNDGHLEQAEVTVSVSGDSGLTVEKISSRIAAAARVRLPVSIKPYDQVYQQIFYGASRKPVRFFVVDGSEELKGCSMGENANNGSKSSANGAFPAFSPSYSLELIRRTAAENRLLSVEIEPTLSCNYHCPYCYAAKNDAPADELSFQELANVVRQAVELGAERVIILGGEPLIYPRIFELIDYISSLGMSVELFSNGSLLTAETAAKLFKANVRLVLKLNSFKADVQAMLTGEPDGLKTAMQALENALAAGYAGGNELLAVSTIICRPNIGEMEELWRYLRDRRIIPYFEVITPQGKAVENAWLQPSSEEIRDVFEKLSALDREYGYNWEPRPPLVGDRCLRHQYSCLVTSTGNVFPCVGIDIPVGNIRQMPLREIISGSEIIQDLRNHQNTIKAPCGACELADECYGCRGTAYQMTGDWLASDPLCWRIDSSRHPVRTLPVEAAGLIPHQAPMQLIDFLDKVGEKTFVASVIIAPDNQFLSPEGELAESAYIEMIAQTLAAGNNFRGQSNAGGMLAGVKDFLVHGSCRAGDKLKITCTKKIKFDNWSIIYGEVRRDNKLIAEGELKIWMTS